MGLAGNVACLKARDGALVWQRSLRDDFSAPLPTWSFRESPLVDGDRVVVTPGAAGATLVALDKLTGKTIWKSAVPGDPKAAYSSAIAIDLGGQRQYVQFTEKGVVGVAAKDGAFLWRYDAPANTFGINISTPLHHDGQVFAASAYGMGGGLVRLTRAADGSVKAEEVYFTNKMQNHHGGMILLDGSLYGANGGNSGGFLLALDFRTGEVHWDQRAEGRKAPKGSVAFADGRLYYRTEDGPMLLIEPSPKAYLEARALRAAGPRRQAGVGAPRHCERQALPARPGPAARLRHPGEVTRAARGAVRRCRHESVLDPVDEHNILGYNARVANTSVHFPEGMLDELDRLAEERGVSRNRVIVDSCRQTLSSRRQWPDGFFSSEHRTADELRDLQEAAEEFARELAAGRRSRRAPPFR